MDGLCHISRVTRLMEKVRLVLLPSLYGIRDAYRDLHVFLTVGTTHNARPGIENEKMVTTVNTCLPSARSHSLTRHGRHRHGRVTSALTAWVLHEAPLTDFRAALHVCNAMAMEGITKSELTDRQSLNICEDDRLLTARNRDVRP
jgi:hypothetical protein